MFIPGERTVHVRILPIGLLALTPLVLLAFTLTSRILPDQRARFLSLVDARTDTANTAPNPIPSSPSNETCRAPPAQKPQPPPPRVHPLLRDYVDFHNTARACLQNPACRPNPPIIVATCPRGTECLGLGDRLRGIVFSFIVALITKRLFFLHQFSHPYPLQSGLAPNAIDWTLPSSLPYNESWPYLSWYYCKKGRSCSSLSPVLTEFQNFDDQGPEINMLTDDIVSLFRDKPLAALSSRITYHGLKFLQQNPHLNSTYGDLAKQIMNGDVNIHRLLFQPSEAAKQMMTSVQFNGDYVSVHIRTGIGSREQNKVSRFNHIVNHREQTVDKMLECVNRVAKRNNITNVFLAADSSNTKEMFKKKANHNGFNVHFFEKEVVHYNRIVYKVGSLTWDAICDGFLTVFADLFMMSRAKILFRSGSNFATLASFLAAQDQQDVRFIPRTDSLQDKC